MKATCVISSIGVCFSWLLLGSLPGSLLAVEPISRHEALIFGEVPSQVSTSVRLPTGVYRGSGTITIKPQANQRCSLEISDSTLIEQAKFVVHEGGQLRVRGAMLKDCQIVAEAGSEVVIESSALDRCELGGDSHMAKSPTSFRIINSVLHEGAWLSPGNKFGLEMMDCLVQMQLSKEHSLQMAISAEQTALSLAKRPAVRYTKFERCMVHPTLLASVSQVSMENCLSVSAPTPAASPAPTGTTAEVTLPLRWVNCVPAQPLPVGPGVAFQLLSTPISGGCTLKTEIVDRRLKMQGLMSSTPQLLKDVLPTSPALPVGGVLGGLQPAVVGAVPSSVKLKQAHMNGLVVMSLESGQLAGGMSRMNVTAVAGGASMRFIQPVGDSMLTALREVQKFLELRHQMPKDMDLEIAFDDKYTSKDGPSAAVACGLLVEAVMTGKPWDASFAVTGDMNADGAVQPVGGVEAKIRGATRGSCKIVGVPKQNENAVSDILVTDGPLPLYSIHVFGLETFEQAAYLASLERPPELQQALDDFDAMRTVLLRDPKKAPSLLRSPHAVARLQTIVTKAPHSLSARYLLAYAQNRIPPTLSLSGSLTAAEVHTNGVFSSMANDFNGKVDSFKQDELGSMVFRLRSLRPKLDARVRPYVDALVELGEIVREEVINPARTQAKFADMISRAKRAANSVDSIKSSILADPTVIEELGL